MIRAWILAGAVAVIAPGAARPHEVLHQVEWNRAAALRASFANGEVLAYASYEVYSPADPRIPHQKGRTDREGWLAFVPTTPGAWRVKVLDDTGHGLDVMVEAAPASSAAGGAARPAPASTAAFVLRPLVAIGSIGAVFGVLFGVYRRRGATG